MPSLQYFSVDDIQFISSITLKVDNVHKKYRCYSKHSRFKSIYLEDVTVNIMIYMKICMLSFWGFK